MKRNLMLATSLVAVFLGAAAIPSFAQQANGNVNPPRYAAAQRNPDWNGSMKGGPGQFAGQNNVGPRGDRMAMRGSGIMASFQHYDANSDGFISPDEFQTFVEETGRPVIEGHFQFMDANGDGKIAGTELPGRPMQLHRGMGGPIQPN
ncbi:EF-hand domain-containing protein [Martelella soudanensis]|uniref:EF-hand domain-containing protein n=1 Tax=unclassified Martelella TaxID=2629616 RepID=UPI0015E0584A|nr:MULTISPECIES: EF-hand domain-containing protein [unclassified Martelella]